MEIFFANTIRFFSSQEEQCRHQQHLSSVSKSLQPSNQQGRNPVTSSGRQHSVKMLLKSLAVVGLILATLALPRAASAYKKSK